MLQLPKNVFAHRCCVFPRQLSLFIFRERAHTRNVMYVRKMRVYIPGAEADVGERGGVAREAGFPFRGSGHLAF